MNASTYHGGPAGNCPDCDGLGHRPERGSCPHCDGTGNNPALAAIARGLDNYAGPDGHTIERCVALALIADGYTVANCDDDDYALAEYVCDGMPAHPGIELRMTNREIARGIARRIATHDGGFVALNLEAST